MRPVGILFIIFPLNLINPRSVMNLEIPIKHIITDQRRAGGGWRGLLTAAQGVWVCGAVLSEPGPWGRVGLRSGPGTQYDIVQTVHKGSAYTIVEQSGNWGKLKSGVGWICLDYTMKVRDA